VLDVESKVESAEGRRLARGVATLLLGGLTAMELLAAAVSFVAVMGLLWMTDRTAPESLVTTGWMRAAWAMAVVAVIRPITWLPYLGIFVGIRAIERAIAPEAKPLVRNLVAHAVSLVLASLLVALVFLAVPAIERWTLSVLGFATGSVDVGDLGTATGQWTLWRLVVGIVAFLLIRPLIPPLDLDLDPALRPLLGFVPGSRGAFDRALVGMATAVGLVAGAMALVRL
jgi:hypothetical protein